MRLTLQIGLAVVYLLSAQGLTLAEEIIYSANITSDPPHGPFIPESSVTFSCLVDPPPPENVMYHWRVLNRGYSSWESSGQNISVYFNYGNLRFSWLFCNVLSNVTQIASGQRQVELQGLFTRQPNTVHFFTAGGDISLHVQEQGYFAHYVQSLAWYHNGTRITESQRITISDDYREMNITNADSSDAGIYQVKATGISFYGDEDPACDAQLLPLLESHHSAIAPVTLLLKESHQCEAEYFLTSPPLDKYYFSKEKGNNNIILIEKVITLPAQLNLSLTLDLSTAQWFHNGSSISTTGDRKYNASYLIQEDTIHASLQISDFMAKDAGVYVFELNTDLLVLLYNLLQSQCSNIWSYYHYFDWYLSLYVVTLAKVDFIVEKYQSPAVSVNEVFNPLMGSSIECTVEGGNPNTDSYNHTIWLNKNNKTVYQTYGHQLSYNVSMSGHAVFGIYTCVVESLHSSHSESLLIPERADFSILVETDGDGCHSEHSQSTMEAFLTSLIATMKPKCNCVLTQQNFEGSQLQCLGYGQLALFSSTLVYSDDNGTVLASTLVNMLQTELETANGQALTLEGTGFKLTSISTTDSTSSGLIAGIFIAGWGVGLITLAMAVGIAAGILKLKRKAQLVRESTEATSGTPAYATSDEMKMASGVEVQPNSAYEAVRISRQRVQPRLDHRYQETPVDEVVYEVPA